LNSQHVLSWSRNSSHCFEPEGSLPHPQAPPTCPCTEQSFCPGPRPYEISRNEASPLRWAVVSTSPNLPNWRTTPCQLSATAYSRYSQLPSIYGGHSSTRNLRTRHAVATRTHLSWKSVEWYKFIWKALIQIKTKDNERDVEVTVNVQHCY